MRQLFAAARDLRRNGAGAKIPFLCLPHPRQARIWIWIGHVVDVLRGGDTEAIRQRAHNELSTYGIGADLKRGEWQAIGRELMRLELVTCAPGKFATLSLTPAGLEALRKRTPIILTKQVEIAEKAGRRSKGAIECDE